MTLTLLLSILHYLYSVAFCSTASNRALWRW